MNFFKFLYDVFIWITNNYSSMPAEFRSKFPEKDFVNGRLYLYDFTSLDSEINVDFECYE